MPLILFYTHIVKESCDYCVEDFNQSISYVPTDVSVSEVEEEDDEVVVRVPPVTSPLSDTVVCKSQGFISSRC